MPVIAVINRKGGSGKSTLATHLAAYCAVTGRKVMLGDVDRQQSAQTWLRLRGSQTLCGQAAIQGWALDPKNVLRAPAGVTHIVLDTPGGMRGFELARIVMSADAILMPVCNSVFDRESAAECFAELKTMPRVASGRCKVAAIGMRLDARTKADEVLADWAGKLELPFIGVLRETQAYVKCIEMGLTLFDLPGSQVKADLAQWKPIVAWLEDAVRAPEATPAAKSASAQSTGATKSAAGEPAPKHAGAAQASASSTRSPQPAAAPPLARPLPAQLLAANAATPSAGDAVPVQPKAMPRVERAPQGELAHAGTLASIGELARTLKAAEAHNTTTTPKQAARASGSGSLRGAADGAGNDHAPAPLRPTRPIVPTTGRSPLAAARQAATATPAHGTSYPGAPDSSAGVVKPTPAAHTGVSSAAASSSSAPATAKTSATARTPARPRAAITRTEAARPALGTRLGQLLDTLPLPRFLQRNS